MTLPIALPAVLTSYDRTREMSRAITLDAVSEREGELSDADLEQVVGGLARAWHLDAPASTEYVPAPLSIAPIVSLETRDRIPA